MKKMLLAVITAGLFSTSTFAGWFGESTISRVEYGGNGVMKIKGNLVSNDTAYECVLIGDNTAETKKALYALSLTALSSSRHVDINAVFNNGVCSVWSLRLL